MIANKFNPQKLAIRFKLFSRAISLIWKATGLWTVLWMALLVIQGILPAAIVYLTKLLVDGLAENIGSGTGWAAMQPLLMPVVLLGSALVLMQVIQGLIRWIRTAQAEQVQDYIKSRVHEQAAKVDLEFYESPAYYDEMERANGQADKNSTAMLENLGGMLQNGVTLIAIAALILPYGFWLPLVLIASTLPAFWVVMRHNKAHHAWWEGTAEERRRTQYYDWILTSRYYAPEVRVFKLSRHFQALYNGLRTQLRKAKLDLLKEQSIAQAGAGLGAFLVTGGVMVWMVMRAVQGQATLGDMALFYQAFQQGQGLARTLLNNLGQVFANVQFLEHLFKFLDIKPKLASVSTKTEMPEPPYAIEIKNVDFRYPASKELALERFNLSIPAKSTIAIVGPNGAGKSTLLKMICRFYDPEKGSVKINGVDLKELSHEDLLQQITVLFQYWVNYAGTLAETVAMGDLSKELDRKRIKRACDASGVTSMLNRLPNGYDTLLDKRFSGGVDLSGGQWQRVALARAFYREAPILLLDEPTSYMDPWEETRWLDRFLDLARDRTTVIVTHRLTTAMRADKIYLMDEGRVVESGTHEELLMLEGLYATSWNEKLGRPTLEKPVLVPSASGVRQSGVRIKN